MKLLGEFTAMLCGSFDNSVQLERFAAQDTPKPAM